MYMLVYMMSDTCDMGCCSHLHAAVDFIHNLLSWLLLTADNHCDSWLCIIAMCS